MSCSNDDGSLSSCIRGSGDIVTQSFDASDYTRIALDQSYDLTFTYGPNYSFKAVGHENVMRFLQVTTDNNTLRPELVGDCFQDLTLGFVVTAPGVRDFEINGSADLEVTNGVSIDAFNISVDGSGSVSFVSAECPEPTVSVTGSGDVSGAFISEKITSSIAGSGSIELSGSCEYQLISISGSGDYLGYNLESDTTEIMITGSGEAQVRVNNLLDATITGSGDISYRGEPEVIAEITGSGTIRDDD